jgi:hypothetical protein
MNGRTFWNFLLGCEFYYASSDLIIWWTCKKLQNSGRVNSFHFFFKWCKENDHFIRYSQEERRPNNSRCYLLGCLGVHCDGIVTHGSPRQLSGQSFKLYLFKGASRLLTLILLYPVNVDRFSNPGPSNATKRRRAPAVRHRVGTSRKGSSAERKNPQTGAFGTDERTDRT